MGLPFSEGGGWEMADGRIGLEGEERRELRSGCKVSEYINLKKLKKTFFAKDNRDTKYSYSFVLTLKMHLKLTKD